MNTSASPGSVLTACKVNSEEQLSSPPRSARDLLEKIETPGAFLAFFGGRDRHKIDQSGEVAKSRCVT